MKCTVWSKQRGVWLVAIVALAMLGPTAWAAPVGTANLPQILSPVTFPGGGGGFQRTFLTTDSIIFIATYYDDNPACAGVAPTFVQLFLFNAQGRFIQQFDGSSNPDAPGDRTLIASIGPIASIPLPPGGYGFTFLVRDCTNTKSVVGPGITTFSVFAP
jgi:hypothetical protein